MSQVTVRIPMPLRGYTQGAGEVQVQASSVREALQALGAAHDGVLARLLEPEGELRQFVNVFVGSRNVRSLAGSRTLSIVCPGSSSALPKPSACPLCSVKML